MPVPKTPAADDTSESKSNPDVVSASPKLEVISASKFADCKGFVNPLKLCSCDCRFTFGIEDGSGTSDLNSVFTSAS